MRRIQLHGDDEDMFAHDLEEADIDFYQKHKGTFRTMLENQGKSFWIRFVISFRWHIVNHGVLVEFPGKREDFEIIVDQAFIYIHDNIIDAKHSQAHSFVIDLFMLCINKATIKYLESKPIMRDPFYAPGTRDVFRRLFGDPSQKITYIKVYFTLPIFVFFGGALVQCLRQWMEAPELPAGDDTYWEPPQKHDAPIPPQSSLQLAAPKKKKKMKKKTRKKIKALANGDFVDDDYKIYLEEKLKGHRYGPMWLQKWSFGDPRFVDEENPLYDLTADQTSDWRVDLSYPKFRAFYNHVKTSNWSNALFTDFAYYHPDVVLYPPSPNRRVYDEIERCFLERCEKYYKLGVVFPTKKLAVDDYHTKDLFFICKAEVSTRLTVIEEELMPFPTPNIFPNLENGARLFIIRKHLDENGLFEKFLATVLKNSKAANALSAQIHGQGSSEVSTSEKEKSESSNGSTNSHVGNPNCIDKKLTGQKQKSKKSKKPKKLKSTQLKPSPEEDEAVNAVSGEMPLAQKGAVGGVPLQESKLALEQDQRPEVKLDKPSEERRVVNIPIATCVEEMNRMINQDILNNVMLPGGDLADIVAQLACDPNNSSVADIVASDESRMLIRVMANMIEQASIKEEERKIRIAKNLILQRKMEEENKKLAIIADEADSTSKVDRSQLRTCASCMNVEPNAQSYKKCQRCLVEMVMNPRYYCSVDCQAVDWRKKHRIEHHEKLMETSLE